MFCGLFFSLLALGIHGYAKTDHLATLTAPKVEFELKYPHVPIKVNGIAKNEGRDWFSYKNQKEASIDITVVNIYYAPGASRIRWDLYA